MAPFRVQGICDSFSDLFAIVWMVGKRTGRRPLIKEVGIGSSEQDFELPESIIFDSFSTVMLANDLNCCASFIDVFMFTVLLSILFLMSFSKSCLILFILSVKNNPNLLASSLHDNVCAMVVREYSSCHLICSS